MNALSIRYPNGKKYVASSTQSLKKHPQKKLSFANRGETLEAQLNESNAFYLSRGIAVIHKKPIPIQIVDVHYPSRNRAVIREAYYKTPSTTDYNGVWQGRYIDFEAKETQLSTSFPLQNIHEHQVNHMFAVKQQQGIAFFVIKFSKLERYFILFIEDFLPYWQRMKEGGRKSITLQEFETSAYEFQAGAFPELPYLEIVKQYTL